jgi:hypothetical protein
MHIPIHRLLRFASAMAFIALQFIMQLSVYTLLFIDIIPNNLVFLARIYLCPMHNSVTYKNESRPLDQ